MSRKKKRERVSGEVLDARFRAALDRIASERLPGSEAFFDRDSKALKVINDRLERVQSAIRDEDEVIFERALPGLVRAWGRVNEILAEKYRAANEDPTRWELRYIKWMKIKFIKFGSPLGDFYLVPRRPKKKPRVKHWYTADEMIDMLTPGVAETIKAFGSLPVRPESLEGPDIGERHMHIDLTGDEAVIRYQSGGVRSE